MRWYKLVNSKKMEFETVEADLRMARKSLDLLPSVTTILGQEKNIVIEKWLVGKMFEVCKSNKSLLTNKGAIYELYEKEIKEAAKLGTEIHDSVELFVKDRERKYPDGISEFLMDEVFDYLDENFILKKAICESTVYVPGTWTAGRFDLLVPDHNGVLWHIDYKSQNLKDRGFSQYTSHKRQLAAYTEGLKVKYKKEKIKCANLYISTNPEKQELKLVELKEKAYNKSFKEYKVLSELFFNIRDYKPENFIKEV